MGANKQLLDGEKKEGVEDDLPAPPVPPDGGWGWLVVVASLLCNIIVDGVCFSFGIFFIAFFEHFQASRAKTAWAGSLLAGCYLTMGPLTSALANKYGCRKVTIAGSIITCSAFVLSTQATSIDMLIILYGVVGGIGFGLIYLPAIVIVGFYFEKKRAFATGIAVCGSGIGTLVFAPFSEYLLTVYDWKGAMLIMAGIVLNCAVCGAVFRPLEPMKPKKKYRKEGHIPRSKIRRGSIMQKIIEEKARQRTISQGSLDGCIITRDNELIKASNNTMNQIILQERLAQAARNTPPPRIVVDYAGSGTELQKARTVIAAEGSSLPLDRRGTDPNPNVTGLTAVASNGCANGKSLNLKLGGSLPTSRCSSINSGGTSPGDEQWADTDLRKKLAVEQLRREMARPMYRKDIFYSGSMMHVPQYANSPDVTAYVKSVTSIPDDDVETCGEKMCGQHMCYVMKQMLDLSLLKSPTFILLGISSFCSMLGFFVPFVYIVEYAMMIGVEPKTAAYLLSVLGLLNVIGRIVAGFVADRAWVDCLWINNLALVLAGVLTLIAPFCTQFAHLVAYACGFGICIAAFVALRSIVVVELLGLDKLTNAFGLLILFQGIATIIGSPIAGSFFDFTGSYEASFYLAGCLICVSGLLCFPLRRLSQWEKRRRGEEEEVKDCEDTELSDQVSSV